MFPSINFTDILESRLLGGGGGGGGACILKYMPMALSGSTIGTCGQHAQVSLYVTINSLTIIVLNSTSGHCPLLLHKSCVDGVL